MKTEGVLFVLGGIAWVNGYTHWWTPTTSDLEALVVFVTMLLYAHIRRGQNETS